MSRKNLKNKPLVEAILEIRWRITPLVKTEGSPPAMAPARDSHYRLLLGRLFDRFRAEYPVHEQLQAATLPDEMVGHVVQHRFRAAKDDWPLVQVGPGVFTLNDTHRYTWTDFQQRTKEAVQRLYDAHPSIADLHIHSLVLRYIDAVEYNYQEDDALHFLRNMMKVGISLPASLFEDTGVEGRPRTLSWQATFQCSKPSGTVHLSFATGEKESKPAILWETMVQSFGDDVPHMPEGFSDWIDAAHEITDDWFFKLIEGELERRFEGE